MSDIKYIPARLSGRCSNGAQRDGGKVVHLVEMDKYGDAHEWAPALCGAKPGKRSGSGFYSVKSEANCERCRRRHAAS